MEHRRRVRGGGYTLNRYLRHFSIDIFFRYNDGIASEMSFNLRFYSHVHHFISACGFDKMYFCANKKLNRYESERCSDFYLNKRFLVFSIPLLFMCAHVLFECVCVA